MIRFRIVINLNGLPDEYNAVASIIQYRTTLFPIIEAESMLLAHEAKLDKSRKNVLTEHLSINVAQAAPATPPVCKSGSS